LYEEKPLGTIGALKQLEGKIKKDILITNCDIIIEADYFDVINFHKENRNDITLVASMKRYNIPYGVCEIKNGGELICLKEKPAFDLLVNTGMYIIKADMLKYIPLNEYYHITDLIENIKDKGKKVAVYPIGEDAWLDTGEWVEYKKTIERMGQAL
jgi:NDP-sugar pyrophosphorylase family protein